MEKDITIVEDDTGNAAENAEKDKSTENNEITMHTGNSGFTFAVWPPLFDPPKNSTYLYTTHITGMIYVKSIIDKTRHFEIGDSVSLMREPKNCYDENAIVVKNKRREKIGYIPRRRNSIFAHLMDAGISLFGIVNYIEKSKESIKINIEIYMKNTK